MRRVRTAHRGADAGFTLIELGVVLAVLAILVAIAVPTYARFIERAREAEAAQAWSMVKTELWTYFLQYGSFPSSSDDWWGNDVTKPTSSSWTYKGYTDTQKNRAVLIAIDKRSEKTLCWAIDTDGRVAEGQGSGGSCDPTLNR